MKRNIEFWHCREGAEFVLSVIKGRYCLPFETIPGSTILRNNKSALHHGIFVEQAINDLISSNRITEIHKPPRVVNPLSVSSQANGKKRLILDLRHVNKHLKKSRIKI